MNVTNGLGDNFIKIKLKDKTNKDIRKLKLDDDQLEEMQKLDSTMS